MGTPLKFIILFIIVSIHFFSNAIGQSTGVIIITKQKGALVYIDSIKLNIQRVLFPLNEGVHIIKAWAPGFEIKYDTINIITNKIIYKRIDLTKIYDPTGGKYNPIDMEKYLSQNVQTAGVIVYTHPPSAIVYIDSIKLNGQGLVNPLNVGRHIITSWAPDYELKSDTFILKPLQISYTRISLKHTVDFADWDKVNKNWKQISCASTCFSATGIIVSIAENMKMKKRYSDCISSKNEYEHSFTTTEINNSYSSYQSKKQKYEQIRQIYNISVCTTVMAIGFNIYTLIKKHNFYKHHPKSLILLTSTQPEISTDLNHFVFGLKFKL